MKIKSIFARPIDRPINGVIKADQSDAESVWQELDEYVITRELDEHFRKFFEAYLTVIDNAKNPDIVGKVGVWISGFFGSGKSHFLKILSYLLENKVHTRDGESKQAIDFFDGKVQDPMLAGDIKRAISTSVDVLLFNIDSKADSSGNRDAILGVFLKVFNEKLGYSGDHPHIANLERFLEKEGKLEAFKEAFKAASGRDWELEHDAYHFYADELVEALSVALGKSKEAAQQWMDKAEEAFTLTVEHFAEWVKEYLDTQPKDHRIIFLVDEIGQFIGQDTHLMLNLQTIVEVLGTTCGGRAWVVVTSQEDIDAVIGEVRASQANDFSKIQGRFRTRLSLSSANVDEVIQQRLLAKTESAEKELTKVYNEKADILRNQLSFKDTGMTFRAYADADSFVKVYPFAPYQFQLVQKIFEAIRRHGVTGLHLARGERSMLDAFQIAAKCISDEETGVLSPLYRFYPAIESFLEGIVKSTIDNAVDNQKLEEFDVLVLKTLFLIRYVEEIKGNVDNLVTLFVDRIDADRMAIRQQVETSLQRLESETLISRNGEDFFFLTNEERDVSREIKNVDLNAGDSSKLLGELIFSEVLKDNYKHTYSANNKVFNLNRLSDMHPYSTQREGGLVVSFISPLSEEYEYYDKGRCVMQSNQDGGQVLIKLADDHELGRELRMYLQTDKYVTRKNDGTLSPSTMKILRERQEENRQRRSRLNTRIGDLLSTAGYFVVGQQITPKSTTAPIAINQAVEYLIKNSFSKLGLIEHQSSNVRAEISAVLAATDVDDLGFDLEAGQGNQKAVDDVLLYLDLMQSSNQQVVLNNMVENKYGRRPYGWEDWETVLIVARLLKRGDLSLVVDGATVPADQAGETLLSNSRWRNAILIKRQAVGSADLQKARKLAKDVFGKIAPDGEDAFDQFARAELQSWNTDVSAYKALADTGKYPGSATILEVQQFAKRLLAENDSYSMVSEILERKEGMLEVAEDLQELRNFYDNQRTAWEKLQKAYDRFKLNESWLVKEQGGAAALKRMQEILDAPSPYGIIKDADKLIGDTEAINKGLVDKASKNSKSRVEHRINQINDELDKVEANADLRNQCLYPMQQLNAEIEVLTSIAHLIAIPNRAQELADEALELIDKAQKLAPVAGPEGGEGEGTPIPPSKKRRIIRASELASSTYLESPEQVDEFLDKLRAELTKAISQNERVEIR